MAIPQHTRRGRPRAASFGPLAKRRTRRANFDDPCIGWPEIVGSHVQAARRRHLHAAIGPGIGECCYEVGPEVAERFGGQGRGHIDLTAANRRQLEESGVTPRRIYASNLCTMCRGEEFDSFRRDQARIWEKRL
jgi:copper oxidase (laccase) domain-containing protein